MARTLLTLAFLALLGAGLWWHQGNANAAQSLGPGIHAPQAPQQRTLNAPQPFPYRDYTITPLAFFSMQAKVLGKKSYRHDREAELAPVDLALGWGNMSDERVLAHIDISQRNRWFYWRSRDMPIPRKELELSSSNMHLIPANARIASALEDVRRGELISLRGYLVRADANDGWSWISSLTRADTGDGACELIWVNDFRRLGRSGSAKPR